MKNMTSELFRSFAARFSRRVEMLDARLHCLELLYGVDVAGEQPALEVRRQKRVKEVVPRRLIKTKRRN